MKKKKHDVVVCQPVPHGRDKQICLPLVHLCGMAAAGSYSAGAYALRRLQLINSSDQIKYAPASLSVSSLTSNKYLGYTPLLSSHTVKQHTGSAEGGSTVV